MEQSTLIMTRNAKSIFTLTPLVETIDTLNIKTSGNVMEHVFLISNILKQQDQFLKILKIEKF
jgi:hypothetical protein